MIKFDRKKKEAKDGEIVKQNQLKPNKK